MISSLRGGTKAVLTPKEGFRPDIEGMRAVAVLGVIAYHYGLASIPGGFVGVDVFFVISGYLITAHLRQELLATGTIRLARFYGRRARRLLPASLTVIAACLLANFFVLSPIEQQLYAKGSLFASFYVFNIWLLRWSFDYFNDVSAGNPLLHFWSLAVEEQFYIVWPAILIAYWRFLRKRIELPILLGAVIAVSCIADIYMTQRSQPWAFYFAPLRAWEFAAGGLLTVLPIGGKWAALLRNRASGWIALAALLAVYVLAKDTDPFPGLLAIVPVVATCVLIASSIVSRGSAGALLSIAPLQFLGKLSYSLYLWHWPLIVYASVINPGEPLTNGFVCALLALALSMATYTFIEKPVRGNAWIGSTSFRAAGFGFALTATAALLSISGAKIAFHYLSDPLLAKYDSAAREQSAALASDPNCLVNLENTAVHPCVFGDVTSDRTVVLFGDSHADAWSTTFIEIARQAKFKLITHMKSSCPVSDLTVDNSRLGREYRECDEWRKTTFATIIAEKPDIVIVSQYTLSKVKNDIVKLPDATVELANWIEGLGNSLRELSKSGAAIVVLHDVPTLREDGPSCLSRALWHSKEATRCDTLKTEAFDQHIFSEETALVSSIPKSRYVDITSLFCNDTTCPALIAGQPTFKDRHHIATEFAKTLVPAVEHMLFPLATEATGSVARQ